MLLRAAHTRPSGLWEAVHRTWGRTISFFRGVRRRCAVRGRSLIPAAACAQVQLDIREGHAATVEKVLGWIEQDGGLDGVTVCDAGCGTGALAIPLALRGARVLGSDISEAMVGARPVPRSAPGERGAPAVSASSTGEGCSPTACEGLVGTAA